MGFDGRMFSLPMLVQWSSDGTLSRSLVTVNQASSWRRLLLILEFEIFFVAWVTKVDTWEAVRP